MTKTHKNHIFTDLCPAQLVEAALTRGEGRLAHNGALITETGRRTGRSPLDHYIVDEPSSTDSIDWGSVNRPFGAQQFDALWERVKDYMAGVDNFISNLHLAQDPGHYLPVKVTTETAWHNLFARNLFIATENFNPKGKNEWRVLHAANFICVPERDGTQSDAAVIIHFGKRKVLLAGMKYAGELKKALFSVQNFLLPERDVLPMHCSASQDGNGDTCLFFGLSGTGKTTLCLNPERRLIGDDELGWARGSVFNMEGGCYIRCSSLEEIPLQIGAAIRFGTVVENVVHDNEQRQPDYNDKRLTENGRCAFPLDHIDNRVLENRTGEPRHIIFLSCDHNGVLPPLALLGRHAAAYHFLSGYTANIGAGEYGDMGVVGSVFSPCYAAPFTPRPAREYADLLMKRIDESDARVYLLNTGWSGGPNGNGSRIPLAITRALVSAIQSGSLESVESEHLDVLNLDIPLRVEGVDSYLLNPRNAWDDPATYDQKANALAGLFADNIKKFDLCADILAAGPRPLPL